MTQFLKACFCIALLGLAPMTLHAEDLASPEVTRKANPKILAIPALHPGNYQVVQVNVNVPSDLKVSEAANRIKPRADIVWMGEPQGNRYEQVDRIMTEALTRGVAGFDGPLPVILDVTMIRFHAQTPRARWIIGGDHEIDFSYVLRDARTGKDLMRPTKVVSSFRALGGQTAIRADAQGLTQEIRIKAFVAKLIAAELGA